MQTQQLQQNMKEKVKVFEDGGIRLLKKGQKGLVHAIFSRFGLVLVLLLLQFGALFSLLRWFGQLLPHYLGGTALVTAAMVVYLLNIDMDNSVRITWLVVIAVPAPSCPSRKGWSSVWRWTAPERLRWRATFGGGAAASRCTAIPL